MNSKTALRSLSDAEKSLAKSTEEFKKSLKANERRIKELETELRKEGRESSETSLLQKRLAEELEDEREQHQKDLAERDFTIDQTRKKYQGAYSLDDIFLKGPEVHSFIAELAQLSEGNVVQA